MTEAIFPLLGTAFVVLVVLPACALLAKLGLVLLERGRSGGLLHNLNPRYVLLTGSSALPLCWFFSASLHQAETGTSTLACLFDHGASALCFEPQYFALALALVALLSWLLVLRGHLGLRASESEPARALAKRLERILGEFPSLANLKNRTRVSDAPGFTLGTDGLFKPCVFIGTTFAARLSDEMLVSALGHEAEHVRALDPLRYLLLQIALTVNPLGKRLLAPHAARWQFAEEAHCDREAVIRGAAPLALADAIVRAARPSVQQAVALGARDTATLKFRIGMLLAFAERKPTRCCARTASALPLASALLLIALVLPHHAGSAGIDTLHTGAERALIQLWH